MADTFKITGYSASNDVATINFTLDPRTNFTGGTFTGVNITGVPKDTAANLSAFLRKYADTYIAGKQAETVRAATVSSEVAALLNIVTGF
jgi:hypothetical protein